MIKVFQVFSFVLTIVSFVTIVGVGLKGKRLNKRSLYIVLLPIAVLSFFLAFGFDWTKNSNNDLSRWLVDVARMRIHGFQTDVRYLEDFEVLFKVYLWIFSKSQDLHWIAAIAITIENAIYFYILVNIYEFNSLKMKDVLLSIVVKYALVPFAMSATGFQGVIAFAVFSLGYYFYYVNNKITIRTIVLYTVSVLIHASAIVVISIFIISLLIRTRKIFNYLLVIWPLFAGALRIVLGNMNLTYSLYVLNQMNSYHNNFNSYDHIKSEAIFLPFLLIVILICYWYYRKSNEISRSRMAYIISASSVTIGAYFIFDLLFLRMCYSFGFLFPLILSEIKEKDEVDGQRVRSIYNGILVLSIIFLFVMTRGDWIQQTYNIFWVEM